ncbi:RidA family protein [Bordetella genomosp. 13]|uniref:Enamine deaminase RidA n=1 Tax=Bordetella genomosp. 13 TaxID=463040 RepID=A0A1W6Z9Y5_9BORD|nr:RidA family protein [Bordetella genomosp. 13]ARP93970.1 hypothetical protein CAL15_05975 [Bordetella genomosp. 13]
MKKRHSIYVDGASHRAPIPAACRIGSLLVTGVINGNDPATGEFPDSLDEQCRLLFAQVRAIVEAAGGATADIIKMTVWLKDRNDKTALNREWLAMFPDPEDRPARHTPPGADLEGPRLIQADFMAVLGDGAQT